MFSPPYQPRLLEAAPLLAYQAECPVDHGLRNGIVFEIFWCSVEGDSFVQPAF